MVPQDPKDIPKAAMASIERLLERLARDRESIERSGQNDAAAGIELLNALARSADDVKKVFDAVRIEESNDSKRLGVSE